MFLLLSQFLTWPAADQVRSLRGEVQGLNVFAFRCVLALHLGRVLVHHKLGRVVLGEARSWAGNVIGDVNLFLALSFSLPFLTSLPRLFNCLSLNLDLIDKNKADMLEAVMNRTLLEVPTLPCLMTAQAFSTDVAVLD